MDEAPEQATAPEPPPVTAMITLTVEAEVIPAEHDEEAS